MPSNKRVVPPQETFDRVVNHLRKQGVKAVTTAGSCRYRMPGPAVGTTLKCAAGCLIPDQNYTPEMEMNSIRAVLDAYPNVFEGEEYNMPLVFSLQNVHDHYCVKNWESHLKQLAREFNLTYTEPK